MLHQHPVHKKHDSLFHKVLSFVILIVATASPLITVPQLLRIYVNRNASGVSSITWFAYIFTSIIWFSYGIIHREKVILINGILGVILGALIFIGTLLYG